MVFLFNLLIFLFFYNFFTILKNILNYKLVNKYEANMKEKPQCGFDGLEWHLVPAAHNFKTIKDNGMKFGGVVENHKPINLV